MAAGLNADDAFTVASHDSVHVGHVCVTLPTELEPAHCVDTHHGRWSLYISDTAAEDSGPENAAGFSATPVQPDIDRDSADCVMVASVALYVDSREVSCNMHVGAAYMNARGWTLKARLAMVTVDVDASVDAGAYSTMSTTPRVTQSGDSTRTVLVSVDVMEPKYLTAAEVGSGTAPVMECATQPTCTAINAAAAVLTDTAPCVSDAPVDTAMPDPFVKRINVCDASVAVVMPVGHDDDVFAVTVVLYMVKHSAIDRSTLLTYASPPVIDVDSEYAALKRAFLSTNAAVNAVPTCDAVPTEDSVEVNDEAVAPQLGCDAESGDAVSVVWYTVGDAWHWSCTFSVTRNGCATSGMNDVVTVPFVPALAFVPAFM